MKICALIVTYNRLDKLKKTVEATLGLPFQDIVIVNNASTDGTSLWLKTQSDERLHIVDNDINSGGAGGFKKGAEYVSTLINTDWVVFYDDDAWPEKNFITNLASLEQNKVDVYCSKVVDLENKVCKMNVPWVRIPRTFRENLDYIKEPSKFIVNSDIASDVKTFSFVGCVLKAEVLKKTHQYIDDGLFIYFDDVYYSYHLNQTSVVLKYHPSLIMYHDVPAKNNNNGQEWKVYYLVRNMMLSRSYQQLPSFFSNFAILARLLKYFFDFTSKEKKIEYLKYLFKGFYHGLRNVKGKYH